MANHYRLIRAYRAKAGLSCADLSRRIGIAESTLYALENGSRAITPRVALAIELATHAEVSREDLLPHFFAPRRAERLRA